MKSCTACEGQLELVLDMGVQPAANDLIKDELESEMHHPLQLHYCQSCGLAQLLNVDVPLFRSEYPYETSQSQKYLAQCKKWVGDFVSNTFKPSEAILEIACNDGYLLKILSEAGYKNLHGIEPVRSLAEKAYAYANVTVAEFPYFVPGKFDLIIANNVLAHVYKLNEFIYGMKKLLSPSGFISVEVQDFRVLYEQLLYDTIYHEHLYYYEPDTLSSVFKRHGLKMTQCEKIPSQGGSIRATFRHT